MNYITLSNNIDFMIHGLFKYKLFGKELWITTTHLSILIIFVLIITFAIAVRLSLKPYNQKPSKLQLIAEIFVEFADNMTNSTMDKYAKPFRNYISTLLIFIFISNISGIFGLRPPTADYGTTFSLAIISFVMIEYAAWRHNTKESFKGLFEPIFLFFPINVISELATPVSLSLRLFGNVVSGTIIMALIYGLLPEIITGIGIPSFLHGYFDLFSGAIQTYVFCILTMTFTRNKYSD